MLTRTVLAVLSIGLTSLVFGQSTPDSSMFKPDNGGLEPKKYQKALSNISISGYYRFLGAYTTMQNQYPEMGDINNRVFIGDDSNLPELSMTLGISPTRNTSISTDLYVWNPMTGGDQDYVQGLLLGVNLYGTHSTKYGTFGVKTGGIHWHKLSPLTFAANTGYNRFSLFERNPWDPNTRRMYERYETYYENGALTQDVRWGQQAFHGFILDGADLPMDFSFSAMHGKSQLNGGAAPTPNQISGGRIRKGLGDHFVSINGIRSKTFSDSLARELVGFNMLTTEFEFQWDDVVTFYGEVGGGNYFSPNNEGDWGEVIDVRFQFQEELTHFPIELRFFRISQNAINNNGVFFNTSIQEYQPVVPDGTVGGVPLLFPFASAVTTIGQMTNNRQGLILNTDLQFGRHKLTLGYSAAAELQGLSDRITYGHPANNLQLSRFWRWDFPAGVGPYGNISKIYRGVYETMLITDSVTAKGFNSIEVSFKTHAKVFNRKLMFFYLGGFHNVQSSFSALPVYSDEAYLRSYNHQLEFYYELTRNIVLSNYLGYDRIYGGPNTEVDATSGRAKDQEGISYAIGLDIELAKNTGLYIRHRWINYRDYSFELDQYKGMETTVEFKIFF
ncbi:hypothetical protein N9355_02160 [Crocinitomicaceae bacterium]|nr:hypothetical protein [Crocinitomicaceae bacterium]